jgi:excisionase family DNA binding protein
MENERRYFTVRRAADYTSLSQATIRRLLENNYLTKIWPPGVETVLIDRYEIDKVLHGEKEAGASA